ncbi:MAG: hypothetical protein AB7S41_00490 [Parvibaculaceae bacterium]
MRDESDIFREAIERWLVAEKERLLSGKPPVESVWPNLSFARWTENAIEQQERLMAAEKTLVDLMNAVATGARLDVKLEARVQRNERLKLLRPKPSDSGSARQRIHRLPGSRISAFARIVYSRRTYRLVIEPQLSDHHMEYVEAVAARDMRKARLIAARCAWMLAATMLAQVPVSLIRKCVALWKLTGGGGA